MIFITLITQHNGTSGMTPYICLRERKPRNGVMLRYVLCAPYYFAENAVFFCSPGWLTRAHNAPEGSL